MADEITLRILRQDAPSRPASRRWETFSVPLHAGMTVARALAAVDAPVAWNDDCEWPACGACTMLIQGRARAACMTRVDDVDPKNKGTIRLAPLQGFVLIRDLWVDKSRMHDDAARMLAWPDADPAGDVDTLRFSRCTRCGACIDACPEATSGSRVFVGPAAFAERHTLRLRHPDHPLSQPLETPGGIADCGHAEACIDACPEAIPLGEALATAARDAAPRWLQSLYRQPKKR